MSTTATNQNTKVSIRNLNLYYGDFHALKGLNIDIPEHKVTAFIGPSGCGKSTCLKTLNRMNDLVAGCKITGKITIDGEDIYDPRTDINLLRKRAGMMPPIAACTGISNIWRGIFSFSFSQILRARA